MDRVVASEVCVPASLTFSMRRGLIHEHIACSYFVRCSLEKNLIKNNCATLTYCVSIIMTYGTQKARQVGVHDCKVEIHLAYVLLRQPLKQYVLYVYYCMVYYILLGRPFFPSIMGLLSGFFVSDCVIQTDVLITQ